MTKTKLYFATNRKHRGKDRWNPTGYGKRFSSDGHENLRFGEVTVDLNYAEVEKYLNKEFETDRVGDGENLTGYLNKVSKDADIKAFEDHTSDAEKKIPFEKNSSTRMFRDIKKKMMDGAEALIYIHGYNVSWNEAVASALSLQFMLNKDAPKEVVVILFSWPSNGSMMPFAAYKSDRADARDSGKSVGRAFLKLRDFLSTVKRNAKDEEEKLCGSDIHLLCHSMGNFVLKNAIERKLTGYSQGRMPRLFKHIFLCAADVDDDVLEGDKGMSRLNELAANISVYCNQEDKALHISDATKNKADRLGQTGIAHPALVHNKVHQIDCTPIVTGFTEHSYYLWATVNQDIRQSIQCLAFDHQKRQRKLNGQNREWTLV